ncbi:MAG TPA: NAD(P)-dependent oxidoreductase [Hyphomicrobiaceae bacterium]|nr:NAD(P)-dependent oxidoreductase [Hyphomicrobiaceae bacterium]
MKTGAGLVVVTGAGGFVGGAIARHLAARGHAVTAIVRRPGTLPAPIAVKQADLCLPGSLPERFDCVIHCAAEIPARLPDLHALYLRNVTATAQVCRAAVRAGARAVVFLSSMAVYGVIGVAEVVEDLAPADPDLYGRSKLEGERLVADAVRRGAPSGLALRLPGTVGRGSHDNFLSEALHRILAGDVVKGRNPDALFNNVVHVSDLARFLDAWLTSPRPGFTVANLAAVEPIPIRAVFTTLFEAAGLAERVSYARGGKAAFIISNARALALGYQPMTVTRSIRAFVADNLPMPVTGAGSA